MINTTVSEYIPPVLTQEQLEAIEKECDEMAKEWVEQNMPTAKEVAKQF